MNVSILHAVAADTVFDGVTRHEHAAVLIEGTQIIDVRPREKLDGVTSLETLPDGIWPWLARRLRLERS